ncbi:hypothetical protein QUF74_08040 [Candidatus Halobeggiatoa sp. HSG11]|nr:hypothetical protein [Candidatus Halobeggiatoa sp. HSG11]
MLPNEEEAWVKQGLVVYNTFANTKIVVSGMRYDFLETKVKLRVSGNTLCSIPKTNIKLAKVIGEGVSIYTY